MFNNEHFLKNTAFNANWVKCRLSTSRNHLILPEWHPENRILSSMSDFHRFPSHTMRQSLILSTFYSILYGASTRCAISECTILLQQQQVCLFTYARIFLKYDACEKRFDSKLGKLNVYLNMITRKTSCNFIDLTLFRQKNKRKGNILRVLLKCRKEP